MLVSAREVITSPIAALSADPSVHYTPDSLIPACRQRNLLIVLTYICEASEEDAGFGMDRNTDSRQSLSKLSDEQIGWVMFLYLSSQDSGAVAYKFDRTE
jgi:hypothetical protein